MRVRGGQSKAGQDPQRSHRGNCKKRILHAWYTTYLSGMLVTVSAIVCPARTERLSLCTVKRSLRGTENRFLTVVLEQQGPAHPENQPTRVCMPQFRVGRCASAVLHQPGTKRRPLGSQMRSATLRGDFHPISADNTPLPSSRTMRSSRPRYISRGDAFEGVEDHLMAALALVWWKVALEHAALGTKGLDAVLDIGTPRYGRLFRRRRHRTLVKIITQ